MCSVYIALKIYLKPLHNESSWSPGLILVGFFNSDINNLVNTQYSVSAPHLLKCPLRLSLYKQGFKHCLSIHGEKLEVELLSFLSRHSLPANTGRAAEFCKPVIMYTALSVFAA